MVSIIKTLWPGHSREDNSGPVDFDMVIDIDERAEIPGRNCQVFSWDFGPPKLGSGNKFYLQEAESRF